MTVPTQVACPSCGETLMAPLDDLRLLCLSCRTEFDPNDIPELTPEQLMAQEIARARERYVGREVIVFEFEAAGTCTAVDDDGLAEITFGSGFTVLCDPDEFSLVAAEEVPDALVAQIALVDMGVAAQVIRAGANVLDKKDGEWVLGMAPEDWLPRDLDALPVIEHGASYAVALLAQHYGIEPDALDEIANKLDEAARAAGEAIQQ